MPILGSTLLDQVEVFNALRTFPLNQFAQLNQFTQMNQFAQMNQWNLLHANQPSVPEATPAPGFEHFMLLPQNMKSDQQVPTVTAVDYMTKRFLDDLNEDGEMDIFNGDNYSDCIDLDIDPQSLPDVDVSVFDLLFNNGPPAYMKEEAKSLSSCDSVYSFSSASPPHSPASPISDISSAAYSTDDGYVEDLNEILERMSSPGSPPSVHDELEKQLLPDVKEEESTRPVTPPKGRRKRGPKPPVKYSGTGPIQLWQFLLELLIDPESKHLIQWTHEEDYEFKILQPSTVAKKWGKQKNKPTMNYEKLSRGLRYYYGKSVIEKVHGKRYVYQFLCNIPKILGHDPMVVKCEDSVEDSVCGEPVMSPEVEDLLVTSSIEDGKLDGSFNFGLFF